MIKTDFESTLGLCATESILAYGAHCRGHPGKVFVASTWAGQDPYDTVEELKGGPILAAILITVERYLYHSVVD